ncbi:Glycoside hydrolase family 42 domain protein [Pseudothermotoga lettingae TMO]|uniref:beta-galactosidase n=2 Tax=Pseudothermotoga TaxID=1643951 RepID=A8F3Q4_PSELT|nr:beta-galactosidase [Pseudothermotoga sp.]ABV32788.1 Glycoside hydrolase family 42 domain protein [Pseudothermotoga lettingae TMO]MDI3495043.1 beta-galactosidase [Pseudothermotoga sp.]MDK2885201.1 beta-galactosidase [Pseudothermotoga sp.]
MKDFFPVSVWYGPNKSRAPMTAKVKGLSEIKSEISRIKKIGFNTIRFWYDWATAEPEPDVWDFSSIEELLNITDELKIKAILQIYTDSAPNWVERDYPDSLFIDRSGLTIHSQSAPGYCSDHPQVRKHITSFLQNLAKVVSRHDSFLAWDIWSEPHIVQWSWIDYIKDPWFCYCEYSKNRFIEWLKTKYETVQKLNEIWYRKHGSWEEITIPRYVSLSSFRDLLDWIQFNIEKISEDLFWKTSAIKKIDPSHPVSSHAAISSVYGIPGIGYGSSDDWKLSEKVDIWGTSFYPKHTGAWMPLKPHHMGVALDASRSSCESKNKPFWIGELQSGHGVTGLRFSVPVDEFDVERWSWLAISHDAKGLNYYAWLPMSCGYEVSGFGLANYDGSINNKVIRAGKVSEIISKNMNLFLKAKALQAKVGILYNIETHKTLACLRAESAEIIREDIFGMYKAMMQMGVNVDFLHISDLLREDLKQYHLIMIPFSIVIDQKSADAIEKYVRSGGVVLADGRLGWMKEDGTLQEKIPGSGLEKVFGCEELYTREIQEQAIDYEDCKLSAYRYLTVYRKTTGIPKAFFNGQPVIVENKYHSGLAIMVGMLIGLAYEKTENRNNLEFLKQIAQRAGINPDYSTSITSGQEDYLEVRISRSEEKTIVFLFNHGDEAIEFDLLIPSNNLPALVNNVKCINADQKFEYQACSKALSIKNIFIQGNHTVVLLIE